MFNEENSVNTSIKELESKFEKKDCYAWIKLQWFLKNIQKVL